MAPTVYHGRTQILTFFIPGTNFLPLGFLMLFITTDFMPMCQGPIFANIMFLSKLVGLN